MNPKPDFLKHSVVRSDLADGSMVLGSGLALGPVATTTLDWLDHWAEMAPQRTFIGERSGAGWREMPFGEMREVVRAAAASLMGRGIGPGSFVVVLSGPSVDHAILMLATQMIGAVLVPLAEQYSLVPEAHDKLEYCVSRTRPAMVYASHAGRFSSALELDCFSGVDVLVSDPEGATRKVTTFADLLAGKHAAASAELDMARKSIGPGTLAKVLFTSGSTSHPKGVPQTQKMMCVNQAQYLACLPVLGDRHHVMLDWLPWNHVFAGNSNFNMMLSNGGSLYLDDGKPVGKLFERTLENMRMHPATLAFNVPVAHGLAVQAMRNDAALRKSFFSGLDIFFYAGASLPKEIWDSVEAMAIAETGEIPLMISSWGMTETAPSALLYYEKGARSGMIGVPVPGIEARLLPVGENRFELRVRGPNVISGYFEDPERSAESFDAEGFFITGDAVRLADPGDLTRGICFDGRLTEDFKLMTGTWVQATNLRAAILGALDGLAQDVVIAGEGHPEIGLLVFPSAGRLSANAGIDGGCVMDPAYAGDLARVLDDLASHATGSSNRIARAIVLSEPPSVGGGEITAKGSLNVRAILSRRAAEVSRLYDDNDPAVIRIGGN